MTVYLDSFGRPTPDHSGKAFACLADWKTSKDPHAEVSLQLAAYRNADYMIGPDGIRHDMPKLDKALMLHITPAGWNLYPVRADEDDFIVFLNLLDGFRAAQRWQTQLSKGALGTPIAGGA
jgi:hypothetical protein